MADAIVRNFVNPKNLLTKIEAKMFECIEIFEKFQPFKFNLKLNL